MSVPNFSTPLLSMSVTRSFDTVVVVWFQHYKISRNLRKMARLSFHYLILSPLQPFAVPTKPKVYPYVSVTRREAFVNQTDFPPLCHVIKLFRLFAFALPRSTPPPPVLLIVAAKTCRPICVRMLWRYSLIIARKWTQGTVTLEKFPWIGIT
jgi:hypothetical protein